MLVEPQFAAILCVTEDYKCIILLEWTKRMKGNEHSVVEFISAL